MKTLILITFTTLLAGGVTERNKGLVSARSKHENRSSCGRPLKRPLTTKRPVESVESVWAVCPNVRAALFGEARPGYLALAVEKPAIKSAIFEHAEFKAFVAGMNAHFDVWRQASVKSLS